MTTERPDYQLAISYARGGRAGVRALLALDDRLGEIVRRTTDPLLGQMRLTWWREALEALDRGAPPAEPILRAIGAQVIGHGRSGAALAAIVDGWEALLETPFGDAALARYAERGAILFDALAQLTGAGGDPAAEAGRGWALADLALHLGDADRRREIGAEARRLLGAAARHRWSREGRMIGAFALLARQELDAASPAARIAGLVRLRLTGR